MSQPITNTAKVEFLDEADNSHTVNSNTLSVRKVPEATPAEVKFYHFRNSSGTFSSAADGTKCLSGGVFVDLPAPTTSSGTPIDLSNPVNLSNANAYHIGEPVFISLKDLNRNLDDTVRELVEIELETSNGDIEKLQLQESEVNSGVFVGVIQSVRTPTTEINNCELSLEVNSTIDVIYTDTFYNTDTIQLSVLVDPFGKVYDSFNGKEINGVLVKLVKDDGTAADVFADDGVTPYPSEIITGSSFEVSGVTYVMPKGGYRFPLIAPGNYRLEVFNFPEEYSFPSIVSNDLLSNLVDSLGNGYSLEQGLRGETFTVSAGPALNIDIPLDPPFKDLLIRKTALKNQGETGDFIPYRIEITNQNTGNAEGVQIIDNIPAGFKLIERSLFLDKKKINTNQIQNMGGQFKVLISEIAPKQTLVLDYVLEVTVEAREGKALNTAQAISSNAMSSNEAHALVDVRSPFMTKHTTIIGEVLDVSNCSDEKEKHIGLKNIKLLMDDGTYAITDEDGRFHFKGVSSGGHVVRLIDSSLPAGYRLQVCENKTCHSSTKHSQFVDLQPGSLWRLTFYAKKTEGCINHDLKNVREKKIVKESIISDARANGMPWNWLEGQFQGREWLFPKDGVNARLPGSIVVVKHFEHDRVTLKVNSKELTQLSFNKISSNKTLGVYISEWNSIALQEGENIFEIIIKDRFNRIIKEETRTVYYSNIAYKAEFLEEKSDLKADGVTPIRLAFKITNKKNRPVRKGAQLSYRVNRPFTPLRVVRALQQNDDSMLNQQSSEMEIINDDGLAYIELAPSSKVSQVHTLLNVNPYHEDEFSTWLKPDVKQWVVVGFAENTYGYKTLKNNGIFNSDKSQKIGGQARIYAKGRIKGEWLATIAYDSEKEKDSRRDSFGELIDPNEYYTLYADSSINEKDSVSSEKLYLRIEKSKFFALFGDYQTELNDTKLAYYDRAFTGIKSEMDGKVIGFKVFGAKQESSFQRDEISAAGFGNIRLEKAPLILNTEKIRIELRDKFNSSKILQSKFLNRYIDYEIDFYRGVINLKNIEDYQTRDFNGNPRFIVIEYETEKSFNNDYNFGGRAEVKLFNNKLKIGTSLIKEQNDIDEKTLQALDSRIKFSDDTELRLEVARSNNEEDLVGKVEAKAIRGEFIHQTEKTNLNIYAQKVEDGFGLGQISSIDQGTDRYGVLFRYILSENWRSESKYEKSTISNGNEREVIESSIGFRKKSFESNLGARQVNENQALTREQSSTQLIANMKQGLFNNKLELEVIAEKNLDNINKQSSDFPDQYIARIGYKISPQTRILLSQGYLVGQDFNFFTTRLGVESSPWVGAQFKSGINREYSGAGNRDYSNIGFTQRFSLNQYWKMDFAVDATKFLSGDKNVKEFDGNVPLSSGGILGNNNLTEEYKSASIGTYFKNDDSSWTLRFEGKDSDSEKRYSVQTGFSRELKKGVVVSSRAMYLRSFFNDTSNGYAVNSEMSLGYRPKDSNWSVLNRLSLRYEDLENSNRLNLFNSNTVTTDQPYKSGAIINNFNLNKIFDNKSHQASLYLGSKFSFDKINGLDYQSYTDMVGVEYRHYVGKKIDLGLQAYALNSWSSSVHKYSIGPSIGISPIKNTWFSVGYNFLGFRDKDFSASRYTLSGVFVKLRVTFDEHTLGLSSQRQMDLLNETCDSEIKAERKVSSNDELDFGGVFFESNRDDFTSISKVSNLDKLIRYLKDHPEIKRVQIEGHTDNNNYNQYNLNLAWRRARRVKNYLINYGIDSRRLVIRAYGETSPTASNRLEIGRQYNRRVQFKIIEIEQEKK